MTTTLSEGVKVPDVGSVNWAGDLEVNWNLLNGALANLSGNVKLDRDNTWTGEQSFTLPIVGSITGTASKAFSDEDGTNIKTGYVNRTTNQSIAGQKTFFDNTFFPSPVYHKNTTYEIGNIPASNIVTNIYLADKNNAYTSFVRSVIYASGRTATEIRAKNAFKNGVLDPTGADISSNLNVEVQPNGTKTIYWDGLIRNDVTPFTTNNNSLGSSTNQWSAVYAQSYYYNGTAWGLDKENTWTQNQIIASGTNDKCYYVKDTVYELGQTYSNGEHLGGLTIQDKNGATVGLIDIVDRSYGNTEMRIRVQQKFDPNSNNRSTSGDTSFNEMILGITPTKTNYIGFNADLWGGNTYNLGTSTNKWKTLNGVNPGALSLPDLDNTIDITSTFNTTIDKTQTVNSYTADFTGWLFINWWTEGLTNPFYVYVYCTNSATDNNLLHAVWGQTFSISGNVDYMLTQFPVISGKTYWFVTNFSRASTDTKNLAYSVRKLLCLGNV